ncbi:MAG: ImmA/IrrE family metallo-endopeptidase [Phycisphaerae bacterium]|nr:ImmA/IrrE family metallo-endopeptidase [Phycisphaerae bacterium]
MYSGSAFLKPAPAIRRIEERATDCLKRCLRKLRISEIPLPVPVDDWIEGPLGIRFGIADLSHLGADVVGAAFIKDREILVSEGIVSQEPRYRFTCAHELGHMALHQDVRNTFHETDTGRFSRFQPYERQADRFAAAFLMPVPLLVRELFRVCDQYRLRQRECIVELMMDTPESAWLWKKRFLPALTRSFGVSLTATLHRFQDIRLQDGKSFLLPEHLEKLLRPGLPDEDFAAMRIVDGVPRRLAGKEA